MMALQFIVLNSSQDKCFIHIDFPQLKLISPFFMLAQHIISSSPMAFTTFYLILLFSCKVLKTSILINILRNILSFFFISPLLLHISFSCKSILQSTCLLQNAKSRSIDTTIKQTSNMKNESRVNQDEGTMPCVIYLFSLYTGMLENYQCLLL